MFLIRPAREGLSIPKLDGTGDLAAGGELLTTVDLYWSRRQADGDVIVTEVKATTVDGAITEIAAGNAPAEKTSEKKKG